MYYFSPTQTVSTFYYKTNAEADFPDSRDYIYTPTLKQIPATKQPLNQLAIRNQGREQSCTGFAVSSVINLLNLQRGINTRVSPRMLYEMAKKNDEWPGDEYEGSSLRGAIKGWKNMGVCSESEWPYRTRGGLDHLTISAARDARKNSLGAYYRLMPEISHFHNALNEAGVIIASARVHEGWKQPVDGLIERSDNPMGGHAFAIVGYNSKGFFIQNSWGRKWGNSGIGLWTYEDWIENIMDAWVVSLAIPTPGIFGKKAGTYRNFQSPDSQTSVSEETVNRGEIAGHFIHIDDGKYHDKGRYWSNPADVAQTAKLVGESEDYDHLVFYFHGGLNSPKASAKRIRSMKNGFKRNRIYPYHVMYDTGLAEELKDLILRKGKDSEEVGGITDYSDRFLEAILRKPGTLIWDEMKRDAEAAFSSNSAGLDALNHFVKHLRTAAAQKKKIHLVGHSTGAIVIAHLLRRLQNRKIEISSCSLMAPAVSMKLFDSHYLPIYQGRKKLKLKALNIYNLEGHLELDDQVGKLYRKSLLYLVSNSFERDGWNTPIVGMKKFSSLIEKANGMPKLYYSNGRTSNETQSSSHVDFDNDPVTMNHILTRILGKKVAKPFTDSELNS